MEPYEMVGRFPSMQDFDAERQKYQANQLALMLQGNQVQNLPLQNQLLQLQVSGAGLTNQTAQSRLALARQILAGDQPQGADAQAQTVLANGAGQGSVGPTVANANALSAMQRPSGAPGMPGLTFPRMVGMKLLGGPDMSADFKMGLEGVAHPAGQYVTGVDGVTNYLVDPKDGRMIDPITHAITLAPGAVSTTSQLEGAKVAGQNDNTLLPPTYLDDKGRPMLRTVGQAVAQANASGQAAPAGAPAAPDVMGGPLLAQSPGLQAQVQNDAQRNGLKSYTVNGQPPNAPAEPADMPGIRADFAKAQAAGPQGVAAFEQQHIAQIQQLPPEKRYQAMIGFGNFMRQQGAAPAAPSAPVAAAPAPGAPLSFMGPAALEAQKITEANKAKLATQPQVDAATTTAQDTAKAGVEYQGELNKGVDGMFALMQRNEALKPLLAKFETGGILPDQRNALANTIANTGLLPDSVKGKLAAWVSSGDPAIGKAIAYSLAGEGIQNLFQTLGDSGAKPNRAEFIQMNKTKLGLDSGNLPIALAMQQQEQAYRSLLSEQQALAAAKKAGTFDPGTWRADYAAQRDKALFNSGTAPSGAVIAGQPGAPAGAKTIDFAGLK